MSKRIFIVRHAKSSWGDLSLRDDQRPLNKRGKKDAPRMAKWCLDQQIKPEIIISSTAVRAFETAKVFKEILSVSDENYKTYKSLYHAPASTYIETCYELDDGIESVMLFGHNPGITYLANEITDMYTDNVPTCGILVIESDVNKWADLDYDNCKILQMMVPKKLPVDV